MSSIFFKFYFTSHLLCSNVNVFQSIFENQLCCIHDACHLIQFYKQFMLYSWRILNFAQT
jgi:hypothetical protein